MSELEYSMPLKTARALIPCNKIETKERKRCMNTEREIERKDEKLSLVDVMNEPIHNLCLYTPLNLNTQNRA